MFIRIIARFSWFTIRIGRIQVARINEWVTLPDMAIIVFILITAALGTYGYIRGAIRFCLTLLPGLFTSALVLFFCTTLYQIDSLRKAGLIWPGLILMLVSACGGYILQYFARKIVPKTQYQVDRIGGVAIGLLLSIIMVWLGCVYFVIWSTSNQPKREPGSADWLADTLHTSVIQWIPLLNTGSDIMMDMTELATTNKSVRRQAIKSLGLDKLVDIPQIRALLEDKQTQADIQAASKGDIYAIWRLQQNPLVMELFETEEITDMISGISFDDVSKAVREAKKIDAGNSEVH